MTMHEPASLHWSSNSKTLAKAIATDDTSWGLKVARMLMHRGKNTKTACFVAGCWGFRRAQAQRTFAKCCAFMCKCCITDKAFVKKASWKKSALAKPHIMLTNSCDLNLLKCFTAVSAIVKKSSSSRWAAVAKAHTVLAISWQFADGADPRISSARLQNSRWCDCLAVANAHALVARLRNCMSFMLVMRWVAALLNNVLKLEVMLSKLASFANAQSNDESSKGLKLCIFIAEREPTSSNKTGSE
mmetsp:Transcript_81250/g.173901  ORF Transcript_81250/g.173901 Transcript_81250/m.173901 type:complete len:244 (+) Transcript_81250:1274-2005(+)